MSASAGAPPVPAGPLSLLGHLFHLPHPDPGAVARLMAALGCGQALALCLAARGMDEPAAARDFLSPPEVGPGPDGLSLPDADAACRRLSAAASAGETVLVWGDYDADGLCSAAVAAEVLGAWGARVQVHIPQRADGYGLGPDLVQRARDAGASLVLAVDCGTSDLEAVGAARRDGLDVVVADHHLPGARLPEALVVNPHRADSRYPFRELAGVGVTWRLLASAGRPVPPCLDLVALGTVADVVPLVGENRALVRAGLEQLRAAPRPGLAALAARARIAASEVTAGHLARRLAPRLNAAGRVGDPGPALRLLLAPGAAEAAREAAALDEANRVRRAMESEVMAAAEALAAACPADGPVLACGEGWPLGVLGLVAGRLCQRLGRPVLLGSRQGDRIRGSARSPAGLDVTAALGACSSALLRFGGHSQAAGFELDARRLEDLRAALGDVLASGRPAVPRRLLDGRLGAAGPGDGPSTLAVDPADPGAVAAAVSDLAALEPHGAGNPEPVFLLTGVRLGRSRAVGTDGQHLKSSLGSVDAVGFGLGHALPLCAAQAAWDVAARPTVDRWRGVPRPQWQIEDLRPTDGDWARLHAALPDRDGLAAAYRRLRDLQARGPLPPAAQLVQALGPAGPVCLDVLADLRLYVDGRLVTSAARRDLADSPSFRRSSQVRDTLLRLADAERAAI